MFLNYCNCWSSIRALSDRRPVLNISKICNYWNMKIIFFETSTKLNTVHQDSWSTATYPEFIDVSGSYIICDTFTINKFYKYVLYQDRTHLQCTTNIVYFDMLNSSRVYQRTSNVSFIHFLRLNYSDWVNDDTFLSRCL